MRVVLIPDKFKGSLKASEVAAAMEAGIRSVVPGLRSDTFAASDGGDGFLEAIAAFRKLDRVEITVSDPLGRPVPAHYLWDADQKEAFVEMASASGLVHLKQHELDPMHTHTEGTGQMIRAAIDRGARRVFVGLGGSATNDGGMGIAAVFGYTFLDGSGHKLPPTGAALGMLDRIQAPQGHVTQNQVEIIAVNDVTNPLYGPKGAASVYAPQKGATPAQVTALDLGLQNLERIVRRDLGRDAANKPGAGAAGGVGYGLSVFLNARFEKGAQYILRQSGAADVFARHPVDYILTGEGRMDAQSLYGKWIQAVLQLGKQHGVPVVAVCGKNELEPDAWKEAGLSAVVEVSRPGQSLQWNMQHADSLVREAVSDYFHQLQSG